MENNFVEIDGFKCYAPDLAHENDGFPPDHFDRLAELEPNNFWFKARNLILIHLFKKYVGEGQQKKVLEIGCGTGYVAKGLRTLQYNYIGSEIFIEGLKNARKRIQDAELIQLDATKIPFTNEFDAIGAFDVIEHIQEDELVMRNVHQALKQNGYFIVTVPQYKFLWSYMDDYAKHKRRYSKKELKQKLEHNGFEAVYMTSFVFKLFPFVYISRLLKKDKPIEQVTLQDVEAEFLIPNWMNKLFYRLLKIDYCLIKMGCSLPFGSSLIAIARKK